MSITSLFDEIDLDLPLDGRELVIICPPADSLSEVNPLAELVLDSSIGFNGASSVDTLLDLRLAPLELPFDELDLERCELRLLSAFDGGIFSQLSTDPAIYSKLFCDSMSLLSLERIGMDVSRLWWIVSSVDAVNINILLSIARYCSILYYLQFRERLLQGTLVR